MRTKIAITQISEEYRGALFFGRIHWFPFSVWIDWDKK